MSHLRRVWCRLFGHSNLLLGLPRAGIGYARRCRRCGADTSVVYWPPRFARGGVIRGLSDPSDDSIPVMLSPGRQVTDPDEAEALGLTVEARRMRERGERCPQCGTAPASLVAETDHTRLFGCHACNETWAMP